MKENRLDLIHGSIWGGMARLSLPLALSNVLQVLFNMADVAVVGRFAGAAALGSVGCTTTATWLFLAFALGMGNGINTRTAQCIGSGDDGMTRRTVHTGLLLSVLVQLVVVALGEGMLVWLLTVLQTKDELFAGAKLYLRIYLLAMPAFGIYNFGNGVFSAAGDGKKPLYILIVSGVMNLCLNLFFVIVLHMDVAGVATATVISMYAAAILMLVLLFRRHDSIALRLKDMKISRSCVRPILVIGLTTGCQHAIFSVANLFTQYGVNTFDAVTVEGNAAASNADSLVYDVMAAIYTGGASYIGQNYGAGNMDRIRKSYFICLFYSFTAAWVMGWLLVIFGRPFLHLFATDEAVIRTGMERLVLMALCYCTSAFMDGTISASRALGYSAVPTVIVILGSCVFRVAWIFTIFRWIGTIDSLYFLYVVSWMLTAVAEILYFARIYHRIERKAEAAGSL